MHASRSDTDLGAEPELATIGKLGRGVMENDGRVDFGQEALGDRLITRNDGIGVMRAVGLDMRKRSIEAVDDTGGDDGVEIFGAPILFHGWRDARIGRLHGLVAAHGAARVEQHGNQGLEMRLDTGPVHQQRLGRTADAGAAHLGVQHDGLRHLQIGPGMHIDMVEPFEMREDRNPCLLLDSRHEALASAGHDHVEIAVES
jgi:hypothetical protein